MELNNDISLSELLIEIYTYYFCDTNVIPQLNIGVKLDFYKRVSDNILKSQKIKHTNITEILYNKWNIDQSFVKNEMQHKIQDLILNIHTCDHFKEQYDNYHKLLKIYITLTASFEASYKHVASYLLGHNFMSFQEYNKYLWENGFSNEHMKKIANYELTYFPSFSKNLYFFIEKTNSTFFKDYFIKKYIGKCWEKLEIEYSYWKNNKNQNHYYIWFLDDMEYFFNEELQDLKFLFYKEYICFYDDYKKWSTKKIITKKGNLMEQYIYSEDYNDYPNTDSMNLKWIKIISCRDDLISWEHIKQYYTHFIKEQYHYYCEATLKNKKNIVDFLEIIYQRHFPFRYYGEMMFNYYNFAESIFNFIKQETGILPYQLFLCALNINVEKNTMTRSNEQFIFFLMSLLNFHNHYGNFLNDYELLFQKRLIKISRKIDDEYFNFIEHVKFERNLINNISKLPSSSDWFITKTKWIKMINELQETDNFIQSIYQIANSLSFVQLFIGVSGFYDNIIDSTKITENHSFYSYWNSLKDLYPIFYENRHLELVYNKSEVVISFDSIDLICSMDVADILLKWQQSWDKGEPIHIDILDYFSKFLFDKLNEIEIVYNDNNICKINEQPQTNKSKSIILKYKRTKIKEFSEQIISKLDIPVFKKKDYYQASIIKTVKNEKKIKEKELQSIICTKINNTKLFPFLEGEYKDALDYCIENEYIENNNEILTYFKSIY